MNEALFWVTLASLPLAATLTCFLGPPAVRSAAAAILTVFVASTVAGLLPFMRHAFGIDRLDLISSFLLAAWLLVLALRTSSLWLGGLLILQSLELAVNASMLGAEAHETERYLPVLNLLSCGLIAVLLAATISARLPPRKPRPVALPS